MRLQSAALAAAVLLSLAACGGDDPARPTTPVTLTLRPLVYPEITGFAYDTVKGFVIVDDVDTLYLPFDTLTDVPRGEHEFRARTSIEYFENEFTATIDPTGNVATLTIPPSETCRVYQAANGTLIDATVCAPLGALPRNLLYWSQRTRILCPANDFLEACTPNPMPLSYGRGLVWPRNDTESQFNEYVSQAKLLVAATVDPALGGSDAGRKIATALYRVGDYSPVRRLQPVAGDSSRYSNVVWTDVRHVPVFNFLRGQLEPTDRRLALFGLQVKATYYMPTEHQDALFIRYDVTNISDKEDYRRVHPESPPTGFTVRDVYLAPVLDTDIGGAIENEAVDDVGTVFPAEGLAAAWDRNLAVGYWRPPYSTGPGLVGLKVLETDAGTPKGLVFVTDTLDYLTPAREAEAHSILTAGRGGTTLTGCTSHASAYICGNELGDDVRIGYSIGPIAALAPGETRSVTVAILLAAPSAGTFTSGTPVPPGNSTADLSSTTKPSYRLAGNLRALAAAVAGVRVTPAP